MFADAPADEKAKLLPPGTESGSIPLSFARGRFRCTKPSPLRQSFPVGSPRRPALGIFKAAGESTPEDEFDAQQFGVGVPIPSRYSFASEPDIGSEDGEVEFASDDSASVDEDPHILHGPWDADRRPSSETKEPENWIFVHSSSSSSSGRLERGRQVEGYYDDEEEEVSYQIGAIPKVNGDWGVLSSFTTGSDPSSEPEPEEQEMQTDPDPEPRNENTDNAYHAVGYQYKATRGKTSEETLVIDKDVEGQ